jgi:hypothetical protein
MKMFICDAHQRKSLNKIKCDSLQGGEEGGGEFGVFGGKNPIAKLIRYSDLKKGPPR